MSEPDRRRAYGIAQQSISLCARNLTTKLSSSRTASPIPNWAASATERWTAGSPTTPTFRRSKISTPFLGSLRSTSRILTLSDTTSPFLKHPFVSFYTARGCPALCSFCLWPQTISGHRWRTRSAENVAAEVKWTLENIPGIAEIFFDDDTFNIRKDRVIELCAKLKPLDFTWSCTSRVNVDYETLKAMRDAGCRLLIVGYESGDPGILRNIKKGATVERALHFTRDAHKLGLTIHGDFIIGLPGETRETIRRSLEFAKRLDTETIQVSLAHPYPGTSFYDQAVANGWLTSDSMTDEAGHQLPNIRYADLEQREILQWVERFYDEYYFRPRAAWRIVRKSIFDGKERRRLAKEAREYLALRAKRKRYAAQASS